MPINLPDVPGLIRISKALAMLDAILCPEWEYRYYSFNSKWSPSEQMASMRNGSGDSYFILFNAHGAILKGYAHESVPASYCVEHGRPLPGMFDGVPQELGRFLAEPAFSIDDTTFCKWRRYVDTEWSHGSPRDTVESDGGASMLLTLLQGNPARYVRWATAYFERAINASAVHRIYQHEPLTETLVHSLNPDVTLAQLRADSQEIAYPI